MKRFTALISFAALLLAGCSREQLQNEESGMTEASFTASLSIPATKAVNDSDGEGAKVNRCIMEIYFENELYIRRTGAMEAGKASFENIPVAAGKKYQVLFWADCGESTADKYYDTDSENGLKAVKVDIDQFQKALAEGDNDKLDAFFANKECTVTQAGSSFEVQLGRPFAQLNIITTDVGNDAVVNRESLLPDKVSVAYTAANVINVADGTVSGEQAYSYTASVYGEWSTVTSENRQLTLAMDYILFSDTRGAVDMTFKTLDADNVEAMTHSLTNLPCQRNYRTNVKGALLTIGGTWNAEIEKSWSEPDIVKIVEVADIKSANEIISAYAKSTDVLEVQFSSSPNDAGIPATGQEDGTGAKNAILTTPIQKGKTLNIQVAGTTDILYIGDYVSATDVSSSNAIATDAQNAKINLIIPKDATIGTLVFNMPSKSVSINDIGVESTATITNLEAYTSQNTLIIEKGRTIEKLTIHEGGLEIHGTVKKVVIAENPGTILVRSCENLDSTVFMVLKGYIETGYVGVKGRTTSDKWDIVKAPFRLGADKYYYTVAEAITAAGETASTITVITDHSFNSSVAKFAEIASGQTITIDLNGKKIVSSCSLGSASHMIVNNGTLTVCDNVGGGSWSHGANPAWVYNGGDDYAGSYVSNLISNYGTLNLNGGKLANVSTGSAAYVADNFTTGKITVSGGEYEAANTAFRLFYGTGEMTVTGGTFVSGTGYNIVQFTGSNSSNKLTISGGEFTVEGTFNVYSWSDNESNESTVTVTDGVFNRYVAFSSKFNQEGISVSGGKFGAVYNYGSGRFLTGGIFENAPSEAFIVQGYLASRNNDTATKSKYLWKVDGPYEAAIGSVPYSTLAAAVKAAGTDETTITLLNDIKISSQITIKDKKIILNTNGMTVDPTGCRALVVDGTGELTVNGGGKFIATNTTGDNNAIISVYSGKLTVGDVYLEGANTCIAVSSSTAKAFINDATMKAINGGCCILSNWGGEVDVNGLSFSCAGDDPDGPGSCWAESDGIIRIWDGEFEAAPLNNRTHELEVANANYCLFDYRALDGYYLSTWGRKIKKGQVIVYGGKFKDFNPAKDYAGNSYVADGYQSVEDNGYWTVSKK